MEPINNQNPVVNPINPLEDQLANPVPQPVDPLQPAAVVGNFDQTVSPSLVEPAPYIEPAPVAQPVVNEVPVAPQPITPAVPDPAQFFQAPATAPAPAQAVAPQPTVDPLAGVQPYQPQADPYGVPPAPAMVDPAQAAQPGAYQAQPPAGLYGQSISEIGQPMARGHGAGGGLNRWLALGLLGGSFLIVLGAWFVFTHYIQEDKGPVLKAWARLDTAIADARSKVVSPMGNNIYHNSAMSDEDQADADKAATEKFELVDEESPDYEKALSRYNKLKDKEFAELAKTWFSDNMKCVTYLKDTNADHPKLGKVLRSYNTNVKSFDYNALDNKTVDEQKQLVRTGVANLKKTIEQMKGLKLKTAAIKRVNDGYIKLAQKYVTDYEAALIKPATSPTYFSWPFISSIDSDLTAARDNAYDEISSICSPKTDAKMQKAFENFDFTDKDKEDLKDAVSPL